MLHIFRLAFHSASNYHLRRPETCYSQALYVPFGCIRGAASMACVIKYYYKKALRFPTASFSWTLGFFSSPLLYCPLKRDLLRLKRSWISPTTLLSHWWYIAYRLHVLFQLIFPVHLHDPHGKNINVFHSSIYEDCSDRTEDRLHYFFRLTSAFLNPATQTPLDPLALKE